MVGIGVLVVCWRFGLVVVVGMDKVGGGFLGNNRGFDWGGGAGGL